MLATCFVLEACFVMMHYSSDVIPHFKHFCCCSVRENDAGNRILFLETLISF
jgi:hypothetical protein